MPTTSPMEEPVLKALRLGLQYACGVAATRPTEMYRVQRQRQAVKDVEIIRAAIAGLTDATDEAAR